MLPAIRRLLPKCEAAKRHPSKEFVGFKFNKPEIEPP